MFPEVESLATHLCPIGKYQATRIESILESGGSNVNPVVSICYTSSVVALSVLGAFLFIFISDFLNAERRMYWTMSSIS